jgi:GntR family transcriptional repressor for pyruvate dehydrogenase complex
MIIMEARLAVPTNRAAQLGRAPGRGREKVSETVARDILRTISTRGLPAGSMLPPEAEMLTEYGVSRGSLREALRILEIHGVIAMKAGPKGGPIVLETKPSDFGKTAMLYFETNEVTFADLSDARLYLEPMIARLAADNRTEEQAQQLASVTGSFAPCHSHESVDEAIDFHNLVAALSGNRVFSLLASSFRAIIAPYERTTLSPKIYDSIVKIHTLIADAIIAGDGDAAETAMRRHMLKTGEDFRTRHPSLVDEIVRW